MSRADGRLPRLRWRLRMPSNTELPFACAQHAIGGVRAKAVKRGASVPRCGMWACLAPQSYGEAADKFCVHTIGVNS